MRYLADIGGWNVAAFGVLLFLLLIVAREVGFWIGRRFSRSDVPAEGVGPIISALLALVAFVLALTLTFANARFSERREGTLLEANAIGTAWLRAEALGQPITDEIADLFKQYTRLRMENIQAGRDPQVLSALEAKVNALQTEIWKDVSTLVRAEPNPAVVSLQSAVNDAFDATSTERFAFAFRFPGQMIWLLLGLSLLGMGMLGYQVGLRGHGHRLLAAFFSLALTVVIVNILDLGAPRLGSFRTGVQAYSWTLNGMTVPARTPPTPPSAPGGGG